ncbi:AraC-like DNA-binding protein [Paenibacillus sp. V4I3]|uniref:AraC family transcriptional regulator n=1 Tax=unclassified Paenibacillus TaxID=185978 RepID=UPI00278A724A|nr:MULTISPECIES: AraC family transcriptional regulator [unclassified Paenibacillus]MDQ0877815.1 AraC-like DNA-binding protein [Paenibacillus sp. V4I3]MDQ0886311.1 AraC-like DNA-binding protein [Paenibacillus sp. V4I9]
MEFPKVNVENMNVKISLGGLLLNVLYIRFGVFYQSFLEHSHSMKSYELHYIPLGQGILVANGRKYPIHPGTLYMTGPDIVHEQITVLADPMAEYCICFEVLANNINDDPDLSFIADQFVQTTFWFGQDKQNLLPLFEQLSYETTNQYIGYYLTVQHIIEQIVIKLVRNYTNNVPTSFVMPLKTLDDDRVVIIENSFLYNYDDLTIQKLAQKLGLSVRQTERTIQQYFGLSFTQKKTQARMKAAVHLLTTTSMTISEIARHVGFSSLERFCTTFKKYYKVPAGEFRSLRKPFDHNVTCY